MIIETKARVTMQALKPGIDLHDGLTSASTPISDWQGREENHLFCQGVYSRDHTCKI